MYEVIGIMSATAPFAGGRSRWLIWMFGKNFNVRLKCVFTVRAIPGGQRAPTNQSSCVQDEVVGCIVLDFCKATVQSASFSCVRLQSTSSPSQPPEN